MKPETRVQQEAITIREGLEEEKQTATLPELNNKLILDFGIKKFRRKYYEEMKERLGVCGNKA